MTITTGDEFIEVINPEGSFPCLISCDHAGATIPAPLGNLGLTSAALKTHIASDLYIAEVARQVALALDAPLVMTHVSRLVVDCNRWLEDPNSMPPMSDGVSIPANANLTNEERFDRAELYFWPYHREVAIQFSALRRRVGKALFLGLHSFTKQMGAETRHQSSGTFWHRDGWFSDRLIAALEDRTDLPIGNNAPFSALDGAFCIDYHSWPLKIPSTGFEIRDDQIATATGCETWSDLLISSLPAVANEFRRATGLPEQTMRDSKVSTEQLNPLTQERST